MLPPYPSTSLISGASHPTSTAFSPCPLLSFHEPKSYRRVPRHVGGDNLRFCFTTQPSVGLSPFPSLGLVRLRGISLISSTAPYDLLSNSVFSSRSVSSAPPTGPSLKRYHQGESPSSLNLNYTRSSCIGPHCQAMIRNSFIGPVTNGLIGWFMDCFKSTL